MRIRTTTFGVLSVTLVIGAALMYKTFDKKQPVYTPRSVTAGGVYGHAGNAEYLHMLRADPATGKIDPNLVLEAKRQVLARKKKSNKAALGLNWEQMGPDNVGGRTRAVLVDKDNPNIVYAGSIAGGLFVSTDATASWSPVSGHAGVNGDNLIVSCITQTDNGRIFFGTGSSFETSGAGVPQGDFSSGFIGNGVYEYVPSTGDVLPVLVAGVGPNNNTMNDLAQINAIASKGNRLYVGTRKGMVWADPDGSGLYPTALGSWTNPITVLSNPVILEEGQVLDIDVGTDGSMIVCFGGSFYISNDDSFDSFTRTVIAGTRISAAIAPSDPNVMYVIRSTQNLLGLSISTDKGVNWTEIVPGGSACHDPFQHGCNPTVPGQGIYDQAIAVNPSDWGHIIVGGVQLYEWKIVPNSNPIHGDWLPSANLFESPTNFQYMHADKHTIAWPTANTVYVGTDGGVFRSLDGGVTWAARNIGFNVTTFYDMAVAANGWFIGGSQDNGSQLFDFGTFTNPQTPLATFEVTGGDGFDCSFSNLPTSSGSGGIIYTTLYNTTLLRTSGGAPATFYDADLDAVAGNSATEPFHTVIASWEKINDPLSLDSISLIFSDTVGVAIAPGDTVLAGETIPMGTTIQYTSLTNGVSLNYVVPADIVLNSPADTLKLVDPIQHKMAIRTSTGIYVTRDAARLNAIATEWYRVSNTSNIEHMEFSPDGEHLFLGTANGGVIRISGLSKANNNKLDIRTAGNVISQTSIGTSLGGVVSLAVDPNNGNNLIATSGGYTNGNHVYKCTNATTATGTVGSFTHIQGSLTTALPRMPVYDVAIDYNDSDKVILGTEWGVWTTDNAFSAPGGTAVVWTDESGNGMAHVPVFAVVQQQLRPHQCVNSGFVYLGTHGRGFYRSQDLFTSVDETDPSIIGGKEGFVSNINVYPNPVNNIGRLDFDLNETLESKIKIYDLSGAVVQLIDLGVKPKGEHTVKFDVSSLSVGTYIISLESGTEREISKFVVSR